LVRIAAIVMDVARDVVEMCLPIHATQMRLMESVDIVEILNE